MSFVVLVILQIADVPPRSFVPRIHVTFVDAVDLAAHGRSNVFVRKKKFTEARIERKSVNTMAGRVDHHRARAINKVARGDLLDAFLQAVFKTAIRRVVGYSPVNRKYGSDTGIDVDVR